jgi:hypothetical protein
MQHQQAAFFMTKSLGVTFYFKKDKQHYGSAMLHIMLHPDACAHARTLTTN